MVDLMKKIGAGLECLSGKHAVGKVIMSMITFWIGFQIAWMYNGLRGNDCKFLDTGIVYSGAISLLLSIIAAYIVRYKMANSGVPTRDLYSKIQSLTYGWAMLNALLYSIIFLCLSVLYKQSPISSSTLTSINVVNAMMSAMSYILLIRDVFIYGDRVFPRALTKNGTPIVKKSE